MLGDGDVASRAQAFVKSMYNEERKVYATGTSSSYQCDSRVNDGVRPGDAQFWNYLASTDAGFERTTGAMRFVACTAASEGGLWSSDDDLIGNAGIGAGSRVYGVRFSDGGRGTQWEVTAGAAMAMYKYSEEFSEADAPNLSKQLRFATESIRWLLQTYKAMPASVRGGNYKAYEPGSRSSDNPGGSDSGYGYGYFRYPHLAATSWAGLLMMFGANGVGNPFAAPQQPMPSSGLSDLSCLPPSAPLSAVNSSFWIA